MLPTDPVPCFYAGQPRAISRPAKFLPREVLREMKKDKLGLFVDDGRAFQLNQQGTRILKPVFDGPLGVGNLLPFSKARNYGDKLHYETAMAGDGNWIDGYTPRRSIYVSGRSRFKEQILSPVSVRVSA